MARDAMTSDKQALSIGGKAEMEVVRCRVCPRLADHLASVRARHPDYYAKPVLAFGAALPKLLVVGLAPGMHGANRTGRPFTGDYAGVLLYETLHRFGYANQSTGSEPDDGLKLRNCRITNAVKCLPPENKPLPEEMKRCNAHLGAELAALPSVTVILALGAIAHQSVLMAYALPRSAFRFAHGAHHDLPDGRALFDSYHCSRYNTQTRRLTAQMFRDVFESIGKHLGDR